MAKKKSDKADKKTKLKTVKGKSKGRGKAKDHPIKTWVENNPNPATYGVPPTPDDIFGW